MRSVPETLIVSWHWPPVCRASTTVLANLFRGAPPEHFRVLTRHGPHPPEGDGVAPPPFETHIVSWGLTEGSEGTLAAWLAGVRCTWSMLRIGRRLHRTRPFARVVAVFPHRFGLLVGWWIARSVGVPLVAYMHDLFAEAYLSGSRLKRAFWGWLDHQALADAALVVVPTEEFAVHYRRRGIRRTLVLPHCTPAEVEASPLPASRPCLHLAYTGCVYHAHEDALQALLRATDTVCNLRLTLLTPPHPMLEGRPTRWVSRMQALAAVREADVAVVVLGHDTPYPEEVHGCFPSKIVDYLAVGRPILAVVPAGSFVDRFIRTSGCGLAVNSLEADDLCAAIERLRDAGLRERLGWAARQAADQLRAEHHFPRFLRGLEGLWTRANTRHERAWAAV